MLTTFQECSEHMPKFLKLSSNVAMQLHELLMAINYGNMMKITMPVSCRECQFFHK